MSDENKQLVGLSTFLQLEKHARSADNIQRLQFVIANETFRLINYRQSAIWSWRHNGKARLTTVSGASQVDFTSPYTLWMDSFISKVTTDSSESITMLSIDDVDESLSKGWNEYIKGYALLCPLRSPAGDAIGGMVMTRNTPWTEHEISLIELLMGAYGHAWFALLPRSARWKKSAIWYSVTASRIKKLVFILLIGLLFMPIRQSVLAPASIVPIKPKAITSPLDGVIAEVLVSPNMNIKQNDILFIIDDTKIRNQLHIAEKAYAVAKAEHLKTSQEAFGDENVKGDVSLLNARMDQKLSEIAYYSELMTKTTIKAPESGVAIFSNANDWVGRPVAVGEKIMDTAQPGLVQIEIWVPVDDAINLTVGSEVLMFLNTDPTHAIHAQLIQTSYQAELNESDILAFRLLAKIDDEILPRLGLHGTAKLYGESVSLFYYLLRRPAATIRQWTGL